MADEKDLTNDMLSLDDLAEFDVTEMTKELESQKVTLAENLEGFAKSFPNWDLLPPPDCFKK